MAWVSVFGPANFTQSGASWVNDELVRGSVGGSSVFPISGGLPTTADRWRVTAYSASSNRIDVYLSVSGGYGAPKSIEGFPGTDTVEILISNPALVDEIYFGSTSAGYTITDIEYDDESIRPEDDILSASLFNLPSGVSYDLSPGGAGIVIDDGTNHRLDFAETAWWDALEQKPNRLAMSVYSPSAVSRWLRITTGIFPDPTETVMWEPVTLSAGVNELSFSLNDAGYPWERIDFVNSADFPYSSISSPGITLLSLTPSRVRVLPTEDDVEPVTRFYLHLEDGGDSVQLPMTSFSARKLSGSPSYLQCVVPNAGKYIDDISARSDGEFYVIWKLEDPRNGVEIDSAEIARANLLTVTPSYGPTSSSVVMVGYKQTTNGSPVAVSLSSPHLISGNQTRVGFDPSIRPGDTVDGATISAVQINGTAEDLYMTVTTE